MFPGSYQESLSFQKRVETSNDGAGNTLTDWVEQFSQRAERKFVRGGEDVLASRLEGVQTNIFRVRANRNTNKVCADWRAVNKRTGETYNIRSVHMHVERHHHEFLTEYGVADG